MGDRKPHMQIIGDQSCIFEEETRSREVTSCPHAFAQITPRSHHVTISISTEGYSCEACEYHCGFHNHTCSWCRRPASSSQQTILSSSQQASISIKNAHLCAGASQLMPNCYRTLPFNCLWRQRPASSSQQTILSSSQQASISIKNAHLCAGASQLMPNCCSTLPFNCLWRQRPASRSQQTIPS